MAAVIPITWKNATKWGIGMFNKIELDFMKYSSYEPNAVDKLLFKISRIMFSVTWLFGIPFCLFAYLNGSAAPSIFHIDLNGYGFILFGFIYFFILPGLAASVYCCKITGYKILKIDIGLRLIAFLYLIIPDTIRLFIAWLGLITA